MRTPAVLLLVLGIAGAGFLSAWLIFRSDHDGSVETRSADEVLQIPSSDPSVGSTASEPPALEMPDRRVPVFTERSPDPAPSLLSADAVKQAAAIDPGDPRALPENTTAEMKTKYEALRDFLTERTIPIFDQRAQQGFLVYVGETWTGGDTDAERREIYSVRGGGDLQGVHRDALPRSQYPELYAYKDEMYRLEKVLEERRLAEFLERANASR